MGVEIERKFLVDPAKLAATAGVSEPVKIVQGYIPASGATVRIRIAGDRGFITVKGKHNGLLHSEFEYQIPPADALAMLDELCPSKLEKRRRVCDFGGKRWEIDIFEGDNAGLIVAEVELEREDEEVATPPFVTFEVTGVARYYNKALAKNPYKNWRSPDETAGDL